MSEVVTIRVPEGTKSLFKKAKISISAEFNRYLESRRRSIQLLNLLNEISKRARKRKVSGDSTLLIREDRDR